MVYSVVSTPNGKIWADGLKLSESINYEFPQGSIDDHSRLVETIKAMDVASVFGCYQILEQTKIIKAIKAAKNVKGFRVRKMVNSWKAYVKLSTVLVGSHDLIKGSLAYLNDPAQIIYNEGCVTYITFLYVVRSKIYGK